MGFLDNLDNPTARLGLRMLANNQWNSNLAGSFGQAALGEQASQAQLQDDAMRRALVQAQIGHLNAQAANMGSGGGAIGTAPPERYTPESLGKFQQTHNYADLVPVQSMSNQGQLMSAYDKYSQQTISAGQQPMTLDEFLPHFTNMTTRLTPSVTNVANVPTVVQPLRGGGATQTPLTNLPTVTGNAAQVAGAEAGGRTTGEARATAALDVPRVEINAKQANDAVDALLNAPGAPAIFGARGMLPNIPGTERANAQALLDQVKGKAFLVAFESLRGSGQISNIEGEKATAAISTLQKAQSWSAAQSALKQLKDITNAAVLRAQIKAGNVASPWSPSNNSLGGVSPGAAPAAPNRVRVDANGNVVQ